MTKLLQMFSPTQQQLKACPVLAILNYSTILHSQLCLNKTSPRLLFQQSLSEVQGHLLYKIVDQACKDFTYLLKRKAEILTKPSPTEWMSNSLQITPECQGSNVRVPSNTPNAWRAQPSLTFLFYLLLTRLGRCHDVSCHLVDRTRTFLEFAEVPAVLLRFHLASRQKIKKKPKTSIIYLKDRLLLVTSTWPTRTRRQGMLWDLLS